MHDFYGAPNDLAAALYATVLAYAVTHAHSQWQREYAVYVLGILHSSERTRPVPVAALPDPAR